MNHGKISVMIFCLSMMFLVSGLPGDNWVFESKTDEHEFGDTKIIQQIDASKNKSWPLFTLSIYFKGELAAKYRDIYFDKIFASPDKKYFLGVSNRGIPGTAFVVFDYRGNLIREMKHDYFDKSYYCRESVTIVREWYDAKNPRVEFVYDKHILAKILITGCNADRYNLLDRANK